MASIVALSVAGREPTTAGIAKNNGINRTDIIQE